jgi:hypothetical protein
MSPRAYLVTVNSDDGSDAQERLDRDLECLRMDEDEEEDKNEDEQGDEDEDKEEDKDTGEEEEGVVTGDAGGVEMTGVNGPSFSLPIR